MKAAAGQAIPQGGLCDRRFDGFELVGVLGDLDGSDLKPVGCVGGRPCQICSRGFSLQPTVIAGSLALVGAVIAYKAVTRQINAAADQQKKNRDAEWARLRRAEVQRRGRAGKRHSPTEGRRPKMGAIVLMLGADEFGRT